MTPRLAPSSPVLLADPRITGIPVLEDGTPLVDLATTAVRVAAHLPALPLSASAGTGRADTSRQHAWVRGTVAERLVAAQANLPSGIRLHVVEGLRELTAQTAIHTAYRDRLRATRPDLSGDEVDVLTSRFVAPPATAPHVSGAAVDLTLIGPDGPLDLGTPIDATPEESDGACYFDSDRISARARSNRAMLAEVLGGAGLVNYPTEWWHWSFGDRYWAHVRGHPVAIHGPCGPIIAG